MRAHSRWRLALLFTVGSAACTNADIYSRLGEEQVPPDRVAVAGELCTENASSSDFPVKVLFAVDTSLEAFAADPNGSRFIGPPGSIQGTITRFANTRHVRFGFIGVGSTAPALPTPDGQRFFNADDPEIAIAIGQLQVPTGPRRDIVNAIAQVGSFIMADIARSSPGEVLRSRYLVNLLLAGPPDPPASTNSVADQVAAVLAAAYAAGALEVRIDVGLLYYGPSTIDMGTVSYNCYPPGQPSDPLCLCPGGVHGGAGYCQVYCAVSSGLLDDDRNTDARAAYNAVTYAGNGRFREFPCPPSISLGGEVTSTQIELVKKDFVAFNRNVRLLEDGPSVDSDGDGLTDDEEAAVVPPTAADDWDTDGDGIGDRLELRATPRQDPHDGTDRPSTCPIPNAAGGMPDRDIDLLNDCEESLLQTSATVPDSDGDGLPDLLEFLGGTIPTSADDRLLDFDADGWGNGDEILEHTDPRSSDGAMRGAERYRYHIVPLGRRELADMEDPESLRGITFLEASADLRGGQSYLRWKPCDGTLEWSDARWPLGDPPYEPQPLEITESGIYQLTANSASGLTIWARFEVIVEFLPTCEEGPEFLEHPLLTVTDRNCYDVRVSNIKVMETLPLVGSTVRGVNHILIFFTQAPKQRLTSPGITRVAEIDVQFQCSQPDNPTTCARNPSTSIIPLTDDMFVTALP